MTSPALTIATLGAVNLLSATVTAIVVARTPANASLSRRIWIDGPIFSAAILIVLLSGIGFVHDVQSDGGWENWLRHETSGHVRHAVRFLKTGLLSAAVCLPGCWIGSLIGARSRKRRLIGSAFSPNSPL